MSEPTQPDEALLVEHVRHLIADLDPDLQIFSDEQLTVYLSLNDASVRRASADALDVMASSETMIGKVIRTQDLATDGAKVADSLRKHAATLRAQADAQDAAEDSWDGFDVVDTIPGRHRPEGTEWPTTVWGL